jgi:hypothetical protein
MGIAFQMYRLQPNVLASSVAWAAVGYDRTRTAIMAFTAAGRHVPIV